MDARGRKFHAAFTLIEVLVIVAILMIVMAMIMPALFKSKERARRISCVSNLKIVGLSFRMYATDNSDLFPWQSTNSTGGVQVDFSKDPLYYFVRMTNELANPRVLTCPADSRKWADDWRKLSRENISYFISQDGAETYPQAFLAGDRNVTTNGVRLKAGIYRLGPDADVGWDRTQHKGQGNACMGDGSIQQLSQARFKQQFKDTGLTKITLAIP